MRGMIAYTSQIDFEELCCLAEDLMIWRRSP